MDADADSWTANVERLRACLPKDILPLDAQDKEYRLWAAARTDPDSLFAREGKMLVMKVSGDTYNAVHVRNEYRYIWRDANLVYTQGKRSFKSHDPDDMFEEEREEYGPEEWAEVERLEAEDAARAKDDEPAEPLEEEPGERLPLFVRRVRLIDPQRKSRL